MVTVIYPRRNKRHIRVHSEQRPHNMIHSTMCVIPSPNPTQPTPRLFYCSLQAIGLRGRSASLASTLLPGTLTPPRPCVTPAPSCAQTQPHHLCTTHCCCASIVSMCGIRSNRRIRRVTLSVVVDMHLCAYPMEQHYWPLITWFKQPIVVRHHHRCHTPPP